MIYNTRIRNNSYLIIITVVFLIVSWLVLRKSPVDIIFMSSFNNMRSEVFIDDKIVLDTILNSDASTGLAMSKCMYASICEKIVVKIDTFHFEYSSKCIWVKLYSIL